jgi:hypothetical protein
VGEEAEESAAADAVPGGIEVWPDCRLIRHVVKGMIEIHVEGGPEPLVINNRQWQSRESALSPDQKEALKAKPKSRLYATLRVQRESGEVRLVEIESYSIREE